ncbi:MAG: transposase [Solirubrobacteraceae bacterium]
MSVCRELVRRIRWSSSARRWLVRSGTPLQQVADELGVSAQTLRNWRRQAEIDEGCAEETIAARGR